MLSIFVIAIQGFQCPYQVHKIPDAFHHLRTLKYLSIVNSRVDDWNPNAMANIGATVQTLTLENDGLTNWPLWVQYFTQLTQLSITGSLISAIPDDGLDKLASKLERLMLNNNKLTEVPKTLSNMSALRLLTLDYNQIVNITWLPKFSMITFLSLSSNNIADGNMVSNALKPYAGSLTDVHFNDNKLTYIPDFGLLTGVTEFNLTSNEIVDPFSGTLPPNVIYVYFGHNQFSLIPRLFLNAKSVSDLFMPSNKVTMLDAMYIPSWTSAIEMGFNLISELTDTSFPAGSKLQFLRLNNNPIVKISNQAFANLQHLAELGLQQTRLTRLPLALGSLTGIVTVDVSGSTSLVCTCLESSLRSWILTQDSENFIGNCGQMSVYEFFHNLSLGCPV
ncbi:unnamed protein product [Candidula unifasciata]|uniref:Uncharacterized protein n=1 Tax=Candidula unifasciata TaxID=100452 RepID=A0A8S3YS20_9EUPU|nr:unnamed protein product [Candidula unifasciata]